MRGCCNGIIRVLKNLRIYFLAEGLPRMAAHAVSVLLVALTRQVLL